MGCCHRTSPATELLLAFLAWRDFADDHLRIHLQAVIKAPSVLCFICHVFIFGCGGGGESSPPAFRGDAKLTPENGGAVSTDGDGDSDGKSLGL